jgi:signal transduction histidine kinase
MVGFTLIGSLLLVAFFQRAAAREERVAFLSLAQANAGFLDGSTLPQSEKMAAQLGEILGLRVWFANAQLDRQGPHPDAPADGQVHQIGDQWVSGQPLPAHGGAVVYFGRPAFRGSAGLWRWDTWLALAGFWVLAALFGRLLAQRVTRPLGQLAAAIPHFQGDDPLPVLPTERTDEIGQLARSLHRTHLALATEKQRRQEAERLALLGRMATSLAHEVRNPLAAIRLHTQLLAGANETESAASRQLIESETTRIEALVSQWLHLARPQPPVRRRVDLARVLERVVALLRPQAEHAGVRLVVAQKLGEAAWILGDPQRLSQALANVVLNAIQAMPHGGAVTLCLELGQLGGAPHRLTVADEGPGFSARALEEAGQAFFSEREGGMGLGLAVAREVCLAHGGAVDWENRPPQGAQVALRFPVLDLADEPEQESAPA